MTMRDAFELESRENWHWLPLGFDRAGLGSIRGRGFHPHHIARNAGGYGHDARRDGPRGAPLAYAQR